MEKYIMALDLGTTSIRVIVYDKLSNIVVQKQCEFKQYYPQPGWIEQDPEEIFKTVQTLIADIIIQQTIPFSSIVAMGITNQRETTVVWDRNTEAAIYPAIVWQSTQTYDICDSFRAAGYETMIREKTGLPIHTYFSASKVRFILDHVEGAQNRAEHGELLFGTIDSYLLYRLSGLHATDYSNASRTMLFNIYEKQWDDEILAIFKIPKVMLPTVMNTSGFYAYTKKECFFNYAIAIHAMAGDQQASLFGHGCFEPGMVKNTYGTGCFMLMNTKQAVRSKHGLLTTIAWSIDNHVEYALEGSIFVTGSAVQWLRDNLTIIEGAGDTQTLAESLDDNQGVYFVPAFAGLGSPYWDNECRGAMFGLTRDSNQATLARATLESICYQTRDVLEVMVQDSGVPLKMLRVDGGAVHNRFLMQFQADIMNVSIEVAKHSETTALGVVYLAGLSVGFWQSKEEILQYRQLQKTYHSKMGEATRTHYYSKWKQAVAATRIFK